MRKCLLVWALTLCVFQSFSAPRSWMGLGSGGSATDINNIANWTGTGPFLASDDLKIDFNIDILASLSFTSDLTVNSLTILGNISKLGSGTQTSTINLGNFKLSTASDLVILNNSTPPGNQNDRPHGIVFNIGFSGICNVGGKLYADNGNNIFTLSLSDNTITYNNNGKLNVTGITDLNSHNSGISSVVLNVGNSPSAYIFTGDVTLSDASSAPPNNVYLGSTSNGTTGKFVFNSNLNIGNIATTSSTLTAATFEFNGLVSNNINYSNNSLKNSFRIPNVIVGTTNSPKVTLTGSIPDNITGNITVNNNSILDLNTRQWNRHSNGGIFSLLGTSQLLLSANASLLQGGTETLIAGSNFPSGFTTYNLDSTSTVNFNGTAQSISGKAQIASAGYGNLTTSGSGIKNITSDIDIYRNLTIGAGTIFTPANSLVTLKSNSQTTANLSAIAGSINDGNGQFIIERYLFPKAAWRFLATPVEILTSPSIRANWQESGLYTPGLGTNITGVDFPGSSGLDAYTQRTSLKYFNADCTAFTNVLSTNTAYANLGGYYIFVRGDRGVLVGGAANPTVLRMKGQVRTGPQPPITVPSNTFISVGNPYASRIDFVALRAASTSISQAYTTWNASFSGAYNAGRYETFAFDGNGYKSNLTNAYSSFIESGQAFIVSNAAATAGSLKAVEGIKTSGSINVSRQSDNFQNNPSFRIELKSIDTNNAMAGLDAANIIFSKAFSNQIDNDDVSKFYNSTDNLSIRVLGTNLTLDSHNELVATDTIFLDLTQSHNATYKLKTIAANLATPAVSFALLVDKFLNTQTPISLTGESEYSFDINSDPASKVADRFMIIFKQAKALPVKFTSISAVRNTDKTVTVNWTTLNESSLTGYEIMNSEDGNNFTVIGKAEASKNGLSNSNSFIHVTASAKINYYRIRIVEQNSDSKLSNIEQADAFQLSGTLTVSPNPVQGKLMNIRLDIEAGKYELKMYDESGKLVIKTTINSLGLLSNQTIALFSLSAGNYKLVVSDSKNIYSTSVTVQ